MAEIRGTAGDDRLIGGGGRDELFGLAGNDRLIGGRRGDLLDGGLGSEDSASYQRAETGVTADLADPSANTGEAEGDTYVSIERLIGSKFDDELRGGVTDTVLFGGKGDDTLVGQFATTVLIGGQGADTLIGLGVSTFAAYRDADEGVRVYLARPGRNTGDAEGDTFDNVNGVEGTDFDDRLTGDRLDNVLVGLAGDDRLYGGSGNDQLFGGRGSDLLDGGGGFDIVSYGSAEEALKIDLQRADRNSGDARGDVFVDIEGIDGSRFGDALSGDALDNRISGGLGADTIKGRAGADSLTGGLGDDSLRGGGDDDLLSGGLGADSLDGGGGFDKAIYWVATSGLTVDLQRANDNTGEARGDSFIKIEGVDGSNFSDTLRGDGEDNRLFGRDGNDSLVGRDGDDFLYGGRGDDDLRGGDDDDTLIGNEGADELDGGEGEDTASYAVAIDGVTADLSDASNNGGEAAGDTYESIESLVGSKGDDVLTGDITGNGLSGGNGDDAQFGGRGVDRLAGQAGNDTLNGGSSGDTLFGGDGRDLLTGGRGADTFVFNTTPTASAFDDIRDFEIDIDLIALGRFQFGALRLGELRENDFLSGDTATEASHRILHDVSTGDLLFDADGNGSTDAVRFATVTEGLVLDAADFFVV